MAGGGHVEVEVAALGVPCEDLGDQASMAVTGAVLRGLGDCLDGGLGDGAQMIAGLPAPGALVELRSIDSVEAHLLGLPVAGDAQGVAVVDAVDAAHQGLDAGGRARQLPGEERHQPGSGPSRSASRTFSWPTRDRCSASA
jgi:hypothetical protein